jgi:type III restriction enzyme
MPLLSVESIDCKKEISAKLHIHIQSSDGPKEKRVTIRKNGTDLFELSDNRACYRDGFMVTEINAELGNEFIRFNNGTVMRPGQEIGGMREDVWRIMIAKTIRKHLDKELEVQEKGLKVLSLFFIDKVANYRSYENGGQQEKGKFALEFEKAFLQISKEARYKDLPTIKFPIEKLHDGYFAQDKKGILKDTRGDTAADDDVYNKIMKNKEQLLSFEEPLRFIFSHSALREGWDNPNVFQICSLREMSSERERRQTIGRGLRVPVNQDGEQAFRGSQ